MQQKAKRLETAKFESSLKMVSILGEMLRESGVKLTKEMGCRMRGMVKRKLLCSAMSHTGFMVEVTQCEYARLPVQINVEEALLARVFPVV